MQCGTILVVTENPTPDNLLTKSLSQTGFAVTTCDLLASWGEFVNKDIAAVIWELSSPGDPRLLPLLPILQMDSIAKLVVSEKTDIITKIKYYQAGVDAFFEKPVALTELHCIVANLTGKISRLRQKAASISSKRPWTLQSTDWHLLTPTHHHIALTQKERCFLEELMQADNLTVSKEQLLKKLGYEAKGIHGRKAMDVMLTRLRRKVKNTSDLEVPIKTIYQQGFQFTAPYCVT